MKNRKLCGECVCVCFCHYVNYWDDCEGGCCCCGTCCICPLLPLGDESFPDLWLFFGAGGGFVDRIIARIRRCADYTEEWKDKPKNEQNLESLLKCASIPNHFDLTCTLKNGPIIWTVVSSSAGAVPCSGSLIILPVTRCNSRTFWPPFPIIRPTCSKTINQILEERARLQNVFDEVFHFACLWTRY